MISGLKDREYRKPTQWIKSRLIDSKTGSNKKYNYVKFQNGYEKTKPYFVCKYLGYEISKKSYTVKYSNDFEVKVKKGDYRILLGPVIKTFNIETINLF